MPISHTHTQTHTQSCAYSPPAAVACLRASVCLPNTRLIVSGIVMLHSDGEGDTEGDREGGREGYTGREREGGSRVLLANLCSKMSAIRRYFPKICNTCSRTVFFYSHYYPFAVPLPHFPVALPKHMPNLAQILQIDLYINKRSDASSSSAATECGNFSLSLSHSQLCLFHSLS